MTSHEELPNSERPPLIGEGLPPINVPGLPPINISRLPASPLEPLFFLVTQARTNSLLGEVEKKYLVFRHPHFAEYVHDLAIKNSEVHGNSEDANKKIVAEVVITISDSHSSDPHKEQQSSDIAETWASYWVASSIGYLMPKEEREIWLGDLYEVNGQLLRRYPRWWVNVLIIGRVIRLLISALEIKFSGFISLGVRKS